MRGRLVVVEGLDGCGKTTASQGLARALGARWTTTPGEELRAIRDDFDGAFSHSAEARSLAYGATVVEAGQRVHPWLDDGHDVVVDRYWLSTLAYAPASARPALVALADLVLPADLTLYLAAPLALRRARMGTRRASACDLGTLEVAEDRRLDAAYRAHAGHPVAGDLVVVDAGVDADRVLARMLDLVDRHLPAQCSLFAAK